MVVSQINGLGNLLNIQKGEQSNGKKVIQKPIKSILAELGKELTQILPNAVEQPKGLTRSQSLIAAEPATSSSNMSRSQSDPTIDKSESGKNWRLVYGQSVPGLLRNSLPPSWNQKPFVRTGDEKDAVQKTASDTSNVKTVLGFNPPPK